MGHRRLFGLGLALLVCCTFSLQPAFALKSFYKQYVITGVLDARTYELARLGRVRLLGVAPARDGRFAEQAWQGAGEHCRANFVGKKVRLEADLQRSNIDGERLVYLYLEDGTLLNLELIRSGYAIAEPNAVRHLRKFKAAEDEARRNCWGVWSEGHVFKSAELPARSTLSERSIAPSRHGPAAPTNRQSEKRSALEVLQPVPPATQTAPPATGNPSHLNEDKPASDSNPPPAPAASVSPPANETAPTRSPLGIYPGARLFIEDMDKDLDSFIRAEIVKKRIPLVVVVGPEEADLVMIASASGAMIFNKADKVMLWASEAGGRSLWSLGLKRQGPGKVAERLMNNLKKEIENPD